MKPVQFFSADYLAQSRSASPEAILEYLESFRLLQAAPKRSKLISLKVPEPLLEGFRKKCALEGVKYQTQIKQLMHDWLLAPTKKGA